MGNRQAPDSARGLGEGASAVDLDVNLPAFKAQMAILRERAGEEAYLGEDLKAVADPEHRRPALGVRADRFDDGARFGDRAASKIVAVAEASRERDEVDPRRKLAVGVPGEANLGAAYLPQRANHFGVGVRAGEDDDRRAHASASILSGTKWRGMILKIRTGQRRPRRRSPAQPWESPRLRSRSRSPSG